MAGKGGGLFAVMGPPPEEEDLDEDFSADLEDLDAEEDMSIGAGPFDTYAETVFDLEADPASRTDALRQAIMTVLEESGRG
jgi:hypothetical protein